MSTSQETVTEDMKSVNLIEGSIKLSEQKWQNNKKWHDSFEFARWGTSCVGRSATAAANLSVSLIFSPVDIIVRPIFSVLAIGSGVDVDMSPKQLFFGGLLNAYKDSKEQLSKIYQVKQYGEVSVENVAKPEATGEQEVLNSSKLSI